MTHSLAASVVISSYDEGVSLSETVASLLDAHVRPLEIVIVDDGSSDGSCERTWQSPVRLIRQDHLGIAPARNLGALEATQPVIVFLDAHCSVDENWLEPLVDTLQQTPTALVGPAVRDERDRRFVGCGAELIDALLTYRWRAVTTDAPLEVGLVPGGCMALRRDTFLEMGAFAAFRGFGLEDVELGLRWWRAGLPAIGVPASVVTHHFRRVPPYRRDDQAWLENLLRTALLHLSRERLRACIIACSRFSTFSAAIATVLAEPWIEAHETLGGSEQRSIDAYFEQWAQAAFLRCGNTPSRTRNSLESAVSPRAAEKRPRLHSNS